MIKPFTNLPAMYQSSICSTFYSILRLLAFKIIAILVSIKYYLNVVLIAIFGLLLILSTSLCDYWAFIHLVWEFMLKSTAVIYMVLPYWFIEISYISLTKVSLQNDFLPPLIR